MLRYHAAWVLPIASAPQRDGWVAVDGGRIVATGRRIPADDALDRDLGSVALMPGVVNAHTHLELSFLHDAVAPASDFVTWIRAVMGARRSRPDPGCAEIMEALDRGIAEAVRCGTAVVGDISNTLVPFAPLVRSPLSGVVFYELLKFNPLDADALVNQAVQQIQALGSGSGVRASLAAHAPYSVSPAVFRALRLAMDRDLPLSPCSVHLAESPAEAEFIATGGGSWRALLEDVGAWDPSWTAPGVSPVEYLEAIGFLDARVLAVHGVQMTRGDLARLAASGATLVTCPRSNGHTGAGAPPIDEFYASGVPIAIGTDSLASTADLNVFAELATIRALAPSVPASALLDSATRQGARALGFASEFGTLEPGRRGRFLAVQIPPDTNDVEEYLVSGVSPEQIAWVE